MLRKLTAHLFPDGIYRNTFLCISDDLTDVILQQFFVIIFTHCFFQGDRMLDKKIRLNNAIRNFISEERKFAKKNNPDMTADGI